MKASINIVANLNLNKEITYRINNSTNGCFSGNFKENEIYATKEDLKNSLFD